MAEREKHPIDPRAQSMELRDRYDRAHQPCSVKVGDLCQEKRGLRTLIMEPVLILWRWLNLTDQQDMAYVAHAQKHRNASSLDCVVAFVDDDGDLLLSAHESWRLEPLAPEDGRP